MRQYEIAIVLHPDLEIDLDSATGKIEKIITNAGGKITKKDNWGKRKLAYKIKKQDWGIYVFYEVNLDPAKVSSIDSTLRITEEVMRYLVVSLENLRYVNKPNPTKKSSDTKDAQDKVDQSSEAASSGSQKETI